jgi:hypothetical protein
VAPPRSTAQAKAQLQHGEWLPWLGENFTLDVRMAQRYILLSANATRVSHLGSIREALAALPRKAKRKSSPRLNGKTVLPAGD